MLNANDKIQLERLTKFIPTSYPLCPTAEEAKEYLLLINRTEWNNLGPIDLINYEKLIYIKQSFPDDYEIQNLINTIFEKISKYYMLKQKYLQVITDDLVKNDILNRTNIYGFHTQEIYIS